MAIIKKIWRDNTMPPTNYVWMKTNLENELIGIYEWYEGKWHPVTVGSETDTYSRSEVNALLDYTEQEIIRKITTDDYLIEIDDELSEISGNPVRNKVVTATLKSKLDKAEFNNSAIKEEDFPWT